MAVFAAGSQAVACSFITVVAVKKQSSLSFPTTRTTVRL